MTEVAKYPLSEVFELIMQNKYWFSAPSRSSREVQRVYATLLKPKTDDEAEQFVLEGIQSLKPENFYKRQTQWGLVVDVYGLIFDNKPWFVKFAIELDEKEDGSMKKILQQISFHPPERKLVTVGGIKL